MLIDLRKVCATGWLAVGLLLPAIAAADSWSAPEPKAYLSEDGQWRLTVYPAPLTTARRYFEDEDEGHAPAGSDPVAPEKPSALMMRMTETGWAEVWQRPLVNDVAPVSALVSPNGRMVTFDNWHLMGHGDDAVVIYDARGRMVRSMGLAEFLPEVYFEALPRSVSSIWWGGEHRIAKDGRELVLEVVVPREGTTPALRDAEYVEVRFQLATGGQLPTLDPGWARALASAGRVTAEQRERQLQRVAEFVAPLAAPRGAASVREWHAYLFEAFRRLEPERRRGRTSAHVIRARTGSDDFDSVASLRDELVDPCDCSILIGSPSQSVLVDALLEVGPRVTPNNLAGHRLYVFVGATHADAARAAFAHTGAEWIRVDPARLLLQRQERLDELAEREADAAEEVRQRQLKRAGR